MSIMNKSVGTVGTDVAVVPAVTAGCWVTLSLPCCSIIGGAPVDVRSGFTATTVIVEGRMLRLILEERTADLTVSTVSEPFGTTESFTKMS